MRIFVPPGGGGTVRSASVGSTGSTARTGAGLAWVFQISWK
jgi:hypothetical protein